MPYLRRCFKEEEEITVLNAAEMSSKVKDRIFIGCRNKDTLDGLGRAAFVEW